MNTYVMQMAFKIRIQGKNFKTISFGKTNAGNSSIKEYDVEDDKTSSKAICCANSVIIIQFMVDSEPLNGHRVYYNYGNRTDYPGYIL